MFKKIVILIAFYFVPYQSILAQNKAIIQPFFEKELKENLRFEIILPYKVEIIPQTIKRSNVPEFSIYELVPRKRKKCRLNLSISQTQDEIVNYLKIYKYTDGIIEKQDKYNIYLIKFGEDEKNTSYQVILIKQVKIDSKNICLELTISGNRSLLDKELPQLLNSFYTSTIYY